MNGGRLTVGASWYNTTLILTKVLSQYSRRYPNVEVRLVEQNSAGLIQQIDQGELDLAIIHQYPKEYPYKKEPEGKSFAAIPLVQERFCLAAHERYYIGMQEDQKTADLKTIADLPFIRFSDQQRIRKISDFVLERANSFPPTALVTYGFPSALEFVSQGVGVTFLPERYVKDQIREGSPVRLYEIDSGLPAYWTSAVCYYRSEYMPVTVESFLEILKQESSSI